MTPADKRVLDLLDRWLSSIELHIKYLDLDEASYRQVQPWPEHERPARWILELAQQKALQLKTLCKAHIANNDNSFAESLELMCFLANLVGMQNIKRFIPLADQSREQVIAPKVAVEVTQKASTTENNDSSDNTTREMPQIKATAPRAHNDVERTREMPKLKMPSRKLGPAPTRAAESSPKRSASKAAANLPTTSPSHTSARHQEIVIADAVRLLKWGREWHELTELIARMAERPAATEIRRILRTHKTTIEAQLGD